MNTNTQHEGRSMTDQIIALDDDNRALRATVRELVDGLQMLLDANGHGNWPSQHDAFNAANTALANARSAYSCRRLDSSLYSLTDFRLRRACYIPCTC